MSRTHTPSLLLTATLVACHGYAPMPVDLDRHLDAFTERWREVAAEGDLTRAQGRVAARLFHPDARLARLEAGVATVTRDEAGRWVDPQLDLGVQQILESVPYEWIASASLGFTLPLSGRLGKEKDLAERQRDEALVAAWQTEQLVQNELDRAWVRCSAARERVQLFERLCEQLEQLERIALQLVDAGSLTRPGARIFSLERRQREAGLTLARAELAAAELEVKLRLGLHPAAPITFVPDLAVTPYFDEAERRRRALDDSPRLRARQLAHQTAEAQFELQVRRQWPDLVLAPGWQEEDGQPRATLGLSLPLPLFNGNAQAIARARAERDVTAAALCIGLEQLVQELAIAEVRLDAAREQVRRFTALIELAEAQVADGRRLADVGQFDPLLLLDALLRENDVRTAALAARADAAFAAIAINDLLADPAATPPETDAEEDR